ncbi:hypothetical protein BV898_08513 [Hypsibius exemplaris]|uniref:Bulb-type lectin domain-containing protein n=1 Tax=Hypsibius exemplaris TaxID=2072580 RepID=A0A1W0WQC5_HYPEX|nr:hypothetical protein BV898_08513 [Hypsibius exemplaris]
MRSWFRSGRALSRLHVEQKLLQPAHRRGAYVHCTLITGNLLKSNTIRLGSTEICGLSEQSVITSPVNFRDNDWVTRYMILMQPLLTSDDVDDDSDAITTRLNCRKLCIHTPKCSAYHWVMHDGKYACELRQGSVAKIHALSVLNYTGQMACWLASFDPAAVITTTEVTISTTTTDESLTDDDTTAACCHPGDSPYICRGGYLRSGQSLFSSKRTFKLTLQNDGNLMVYRLDGGAEIPTWASGTFIMYEKSRSVHVLLNGDVLLINARGEAV